MPAMTDTEQHANALMSCAIALQTLGVSNQRVLLPAGQPEYARHRLQSAAHDFGGIGAAWLRQASDGPLL